MGTLLTYELSDGIATITMNDGKANVFSPVMLAELNAAFDRAEADAATVILTGRPGLFSGGFDLKVLNAGGPIARAMLKTGFSLAARILGNERPVVIAPTGHALAMGAFMVLSGDYRVGPAGAFKFGANEVAIGLTLPTFGVEICRQRLTPSAFTRATINAEMFSPANAVEVGFLDRVVPADELAATAREIALGLNALDARAFMLTKQQVRGDTLAKLHAAIEHDDAQLANWA
jgi:enoyl-CoA hydratase